MEKARSVPNRGYYFDFLTLAKSMAKFQTPATSPVSLMYALDLQLDKMMAEGMENRFARHLALRDRTIAWARGHDFSLYAAPGYESPTVTCVNNDRNVDIGALNSHLRERGMIISNGYGSLKGQNFRIAHMGDTTMADMEELFAAMDEFFLN